MGEGDGRGGVRRKVAPNPGTQAGSPGIGAGSESVSGTCVRC